MAESKYLKLANWTRRLAAVTIYANKEIVEAAFNLYRVPSASS